MRAFCCSSVSLLGALLLFAACQPTPTPTPTAVPATSVLTIWRWESSPTEAVALQQQVDAFLAANPAISVTVESKSSYRAALQEAAATRTLPDLFLLDGTTVAEMRQSNHLLPLQNALSSVEDFYPVARQMFGEQGALWCAPRDLSTLALVYNPTLLAAKGIAAPDASWTWQQMRAAAEGANDLSQGQFGMGLTADVTRLLPFVHAAGGSLPFEEMGATAFAGPGVAEALAYYTAFGADDVSAEPIDVQSTWAGESFAHQRAVMVIEGSWIVRWLAQNFPPVIEIEGHVDLPGLDVGYAELPQGLVGRSTLVFGTCWGVNASSANPAIAAQLADFLTGGEQARLWSNATGMIPARQSIAQPWLEANPVYAPFVAGLEYSVPWRTGARWQPVIDALNDGIHALFYSETTVEEVLAEADALYQQLSDAP